MCMYLLFFHTFFNKAIIAFTVQEFKCIVDGKSVICFSIRFVKDAIMLNDREGSRQNVKICQRLERKEKMITTQPNTSNMSTLLEDNLSDSL